MNVICFGDSNTYGYDPRSYFGGRYEKEDRWVDLLAAQTGWTVRNCGANGREIPRTAAPLPDGVDLFLVMLGSNDLLQGWRPEEVSARMRRFLESLPLARERILLIAPPPMTAGDWVQDARLIGASAELAACYRALAQQLGVRFADAGQWTVALSYDGVHFTAQGHRAFAGGLLRELNR